MKQYQLTDGQEVFSTAWFTPWEAKEAEKQAIEATDNNVWWEPVEA